MCYVRDKLQIAYLMFEARYKMCASVLLLNMSYDYAEINKNKYIPQAYHNVRFNIKNC